MTCSASSAIQVVAILATQAVPSRTFVAVGRAENTFERCRVQLTRSRQALPTDGVAILDFRNTPSTVVLVPVFALGTYLPIAFCTVAQTLPLASQDTVVFH